MDSSNGDRGRSFFYWYSLVFITTVAVCQVAKLYEITHPIVIIITEQLRRTDRIQALVKGAISLGGVTGGMMRIMAQQIILKRLASYFYPL